MQRYFTHIFSSLLVLATVSCVQKSNMNDIFETKTDIKPFAEAKTLNEIYGDGKTITKSLRIPLTKDTLGFFDRDEIVESRNIPEKHKKFFEKIKDNIVHGLYNQAVKLGVKNRISYSTDFEFPEIDSESIHSISVKKIFMALENCAPNDEECHHRIKDQEITLGLLDSLFINISPITEKSNLDFLKEPFDFYRDKAYQKILQQSKKASYLSMDGITNIAHLGTLEEDAYNVYEQVEQKSKTLVLSLESHENVEALKFFREDVFAEVITDVFKAGKVIFITLKDDELVTSFFKKVFDRVESFADIGIYDYRFCSFKSCTELDVNPINLVPLIAQSPHLRFDTYLAIRQLSYNDFQYNGYIELEIKMSIDL
jgi:hypothetical protein